jgi:hypothetical protein
MLLSLTFALLQRPGVRDANAARAKVSESYLQNCSQIWVVAPIRRAVDDGTAKDLMGEQFKRRLLMDGQYNNVSFICTQTDDCEVMETIRDHQDVAEREPGRWEKMQTLLEKIAAIEKQLVDFDQTKEDLKMELEDAKEEEAAASDELKEAQEEEMLDDDDDSSASSMVANLVIALKEKKMAVAEALDKFESYVQENEGTAVNLNLECRTLQRSLKAICALVRNEYSKECLQEDFRAGLKELYRKDDDDGLEPEEVELPDDVNLDVFAISANDYLKIRG